ncbi:MAG: hypothetical protein A2W11_07490 [Ignavibacteria bacterium RBG_16_35_7]|nr:MAG: hypothetical protein A2W11_07490 [Ignavibacteria bacterium RBG_16_35_7]
MSFFKDILSDIGKLGTPENAYKKAFVELYKELTKYKVNCSPLEKKIFVSKIIYLQNILDQKYEAIENKNALIKIYHEIKDLEVKISTSFIAAGLCVQFVFENKRTADFDILLLSFQLAEDSIAKSFERSTPSNNILQLEVDKFILFAADNANRIIDFWKVNNPQLANNNSRNELFLCFVAILDSTLEIGRQQEINTLKLKFLNNSIENLINNGIIILDYNIENQIISMSPNDFISFQKNLPKGFAKKRLEKYRELFPYLGSNIAGQGLANERYKLGERHVFFITAIGLSFCIQKETNLALLIKKPYNIWGMNSDLIKESKEIEQLFLDYFRLVQNQLIISAGGLFSL